MVGSGTKVDSCDRKTGVTIGRSDLGVEGMDLGPGKGGGPLRKRKCSWFHRGCQVTTFGCFRTQQTSHLKLIGP